MTASSEDKTPPAPDAGEDTQSESSEAPKPEKEEEPKETFKDKLEFYLNTLVICTAIGTFTAFVFTVPFDIDPALATINHEFIGPVDCQTVSAEHYIGSENCTSLEGWASCREGCTKEFYECDRLHVQYPPEGCSRSDNSCLTIARLLVNVKGCGYPPKVRCWEFWQNHHNTSIIFPCWYSKVEPNLAITDFVEGGALKQAILSFTLPIGLFTLSMIYISLKWCVCCHRHIDLSHLELNEDAERGESGDEIEIDEGDERAEAAVAK